MANTDGRKTGIHDVATGRLLANRWQVLDVMGGGGMGIVYRCFDMNLKTTVAVKILNKEFQEDRKIVERFHREVEILIKSAHPNIAVIHACSSREEEPPVFLVMELLDGPTLKTVIDESPGRRLHPQRILRVGTQVLDALDAVHARGIIHRDLKPENIFVLLPSGAGRRNIDVTKVIDFGIAKSSEGQAGEGEASLTQVGTVVGTPYYMSPEQCLGAAYADHRSDLYAMGVILYEMATGKLPFDKPTREEIMTAHIAECPDSPSMLNPDISPELELVILKAMAKKARDRFSNALEMSEALEEAIPEDKTYYRDSQRVSPVDGRASAIPPHIAALPTPDSRPIPDVSATPTNLLDSGKPPAAAEIGLAKTITPTDLDREARVVAEVAVAAAEKASLAVVSTPDITVPPTGGAPGGDLVKGARVPFDAAVAYAKQFGVWIGEVPRQAKIIASAGIGLVLLLLVLVATASRGCRNGSAPGDAGKIGEAAAAVSDAETSAPPDRQPDVVVIRIPVPTPPVPLSAPGDATTETPDETTDATPAEETDYAAEVSLPDVPEVTIPEPPNGYDELMRRGESASEERNFSLALRKFKAATELWPEGPRAWRRLGDTLVILGERSKAKTAYQEYLRLAPDASDAGFIRRLVERW